MKNEEKSGKVVVKYNGLAGWDIDIPGRGKEAIRPGAEISFDLNDPPQLHVLLGIIKEVNRPRTNVRTALEKSKGDGFRDQVKIPKFEIVKGQELLPEALQKHQYSASNMLTDDEAEAIKSVCPKYFDRKPTTKRMVM